ncbi:MAG: TonB-dependent receptor plug domain-containing protein [Leptolyngbyaceae cyanobacterium SM1_3_5]|nr:TonB-dependent receptor plug domain-containing protein [Leptolyngbyaceae cyanobacterium SM1_3_5]
MLYGAPGVSSRIIRGFDQGFADAGGNLRNGTRDDGASGVRPIETVEQVEVLRETASVLFGAVEPGGVINVITRQPLSELYYNLRLEAGNYSFYQPVLTCQDL